MLKEYKEKQSAWHTVMENYLNILITRMLRKTEVGAQSEEVGDVWKELSDFIDANLQTELSLSALASKCFYNPSYFSRAFKEKFSVSPGEYITRKRLERAKQLLCETDLSVDEIGRQSGFSDRSRFYYAFSKYGGMTPGDYRKSYSNVKKSDK
jgi:AraC-like DNA-binding protein